jgi:hypothetical protein
MGCGTSCDAAADLTPACTSSAMCTVPSAPICDAVKQSCRACAPAGMSSPDCTDATKRLCSSSGACVECLGKTDCIGKSQACDTTSGTCVACKANSDCASSFCCTGGKLPDGVTACTVGTCIDPSTVVYVSASGRSCPGGLGQGMLTDPFCKIQDGLNAASGSSMASHTAIVQAGTYAENLSIKPAVSTTYVVHAVGVGGPIVAPTSAGAALTIDKSLGATSIDVSLDGFTIQGATDTVPGTSNDGHGIQCTGVTTAATKLRLTHSTLTSNAQTGINALSCTVLLDQDTISSNAGGGVALSNSEFTLQNLLLFNNGSASTDFGGIKANSPGATKNIFYATIVNNKMKNSLQPSAGIACASGVVVTNSVLLGNSGGNAEIDPGTCAVDHSSWVNAPAANGNQDLTACGTNADQRAAAIFAAPPTDYHPLNGGAMKPCTLVGLGTGLSSPTYDLDGKNRPAMPSIGAYEPK